MSLRERLEAARIGPEPMTRIVYVDDLDEALRLLEEAREAFHSIGYVTIVNEDAAYRPDAASYKKPSEFHPFAMTVARAQAADLDKALGEP